MIKFLSLNKKNILIIKLLACFFVTSAFATQDEGQKTNTATNRLPWAQGVLSELKIHAPISWLIDSKPCPAGLKPSYKITVKQTDTLTSKVQLDVEYVDADNWTNKLYIRFKKAYLETPEGDKPIDIYYWIYCDKA